jgi:hypothetical protein
MQETMQEKTSRASVRRFTSCAELANQVLVRAAIVSDSGVLGVSHFIPGKEDSSFR